TRGNLDDQVFRRRRAGPRSGQSDPGPWRAGIDRRPGPGPLVSARTRRAYLRRTRRSASGARRTAYLEPLRCGCVAAGLKLSLMNGAYQTSLDQPQPVRPGDELALARLEAFLKSRFPEWVGPLVVQQFPQGYSTLTYSVRIGEQELVL